MSAGACPSTSCLQNCPLEPQTMQDLQGLSSLNTRNLSQECLSVSSWSIVILLSNFFLSPPSINSPQAPSCTKRSPNQTYIAASAILRPAPPPKKKGKTPPHCKQASHTAISVQLGALPLYHSNLLEWSGWKVTAASRHYRDNPERIIIDETSGLQALPIGVGPAH